MTGAYATKLDGIAAGATNVTNNNQLINGAGYTTNTGTVTGVSGTAPIISSGGAAPAISISAATTSAAGSMSAADKSKLDGATSFNTASAIVARNLSGNFSAGTITATLNGSATSAGSATTAGTVTTPAQGNITSVGTLTSLSTGNVTNSGYFIRSVATGIVAAGTGSQSGSTGLTKEINVVSTVPGASGVRLPAATAGMMLTIINTTATSLLVFPASGAAINTLAANGFFTHTGGATLQYVAVSATQWYTVGATYA
jgi:hypothetical protein